jgi:transcriptional regulator NrdR family protein
MTDKMKEAMTKCDCVLCGRPEDESTPSFSWYLSAVGESRCPECGNKQGVDVERLRAEIEVLQAENERLRAEASRADEEATTLADSDLATTEQVLHFKNTVIRSLRSDNERLRKACALALSVMEQPNRVAVPSYVKHVKSFAVSFDPEDIAVLREALAEHDEAAVAALVKEHSPKNTTKKPLPSR